ncbi:MAG: hypothetical protein FWC57_00945 [Endomicrobia bacterium]|nr:hypothetical protein [Endomicrobiia bacterium]
MNFKDYFGIEKNDVLKNCILCQSYDLPLFSKESENGFFVKTSKTKNATVIAMKNNFLAGDTVLYLKDSKCENIILFGSCGVCGDLESGDLIMSAKACNLESFSRMLASRMLSFDKTPDFVEADAGLTAKFYSRYPYEDLISANSACVSSLVLEEQYAGWFKKNGIYAVDMESSIVFSAARTIGAHAACFMYAADHIEKSPVGQKLAEKTKSSIAAARKKLAKMILDFANEVI